MPTSFAPSPRSRSSLVTLASLLVMVGLTSSLGLARTVWGGPPADAEQPPVESEAAPEQPAGDVATDDLVGTDPTAVPPVADPAEPAATETLPAEAVLDEAGASVPGASSLRAKMESGMSEIGELAVEARGDEDLVRATCVLDKQDRANDVMDLGTSELLIIRDPGTSEQARSFALEKLEAASGRIDKLVTEAKGCSGEQGPEDEVDVTRRDADEPDTIPILNPTIGLGESPVPPSVDGGWPPAASPIE
jgi:hypothetical protein